MSTPREPNPPSRREEDFPKTNTIPDGWVMDALMEIYNETGCVGDRGVAQPAGSQPVEVIPVPATGVTCDKTNGRSHPVDSAANQPATSGEGESLFSHRLEPFPSAWDLTGMWL